MENKDLLALEITALKTLAGCGATLNDLFAQWELFPDQTLETLVASICTIKSGAGQERTEPFAPDVPVKAPVEAPVEAPAPVEPPPTEQPAS